MESPAKTAIAKDGRVLSVLKKDYKALYEKYKALYESALERLEGKQKQKRSSQRQKDEKPAAGFGRKGPKCDRPVGKKLSHSKIK